METLIKWLCIKKLLYFSGWFRAILPKTALRVEEESWNAYPYTKTRYTCPFIEKFSLEVETKYLPDAGQQDNVFNLSSAEAKSRFIGEYGCIRCVSTKKRRILNIWVNLSSVEAKSRFIGEFGYCVTSQKKDSIEIEYMMITMIQLPQPLKVFCINYDLVCPAQRLKSIQVSWDIFHQNMDNIEAANNHGGFNCSCSLEVSRLKEDTCKWVWIM